MISVAQLIELQDTSKGLDGNLKLNGILIMSNNEEQHMKTTCLKCGKEFNLDMYTVILGHETYAPYSMCAVITCPHCKKRKEF